MSKIIAVASALCFTCSSAMADASTMCTYSLLLETHIMISACGDSLDAGSEARYQQLIAEIRKNIVRNTHEPGKQPSDVEKSLNQYDSTVRARYLKVNDKLCKSKDYADYREMLARFTAPENSSKILDDVKHSTKGPNEGECI